MFDRLILTEELVDCRGDLVAARGTVLSAESIAEVGRRAPPRNRRHLEDTPLADDVGGPLCDASYRHLFGSEPVRDAVRRALLSVRLPDILVEELLAIRRAAPELHVHALAAAAVAVRILLSVVGSSRALPELAAAALLHDVGMRHLPARLLRRHDSLTKEDALRIASHPLVGAYHLASVLGAHPAVAAARSHHWRCGQGYPALDKAPSRSVEVISVASAFAALTHPRAFRATVYDARGASDVLAAEAASGYADANTVKLLVHALRGGRGDPRGVRFGKPREGHGPDVHQYVHVSAPARSPV
jgi:HD-GYP domain-containing protein (c-di-GMP phosphodiesterase class II)